MVPVSVDALRIIASAARRCRSVSARPRSPTAFGRWKTQFCQAVRRPKIRVSIVSGPANTQIGLHRRQRVGREARALLQQQAHLVVPVDLVEGAVTRPSASAASLSSASPTRRGRAPRASGSPRKRVGEPGEAVAHRIGAESSSRSAAARRRAVVAADAAGEHQAAVGRERQARRACRRSSCPARSARSGCARSCRAVSARA